MSKKNKTSLNALPEPRPPETMVEPAPDARLVELTAAYVDARDLIAIYRHLRMTPALQAKAARFFAALDALAREP